MRSQPNNPPSSHHPPSGMTTIVVVWLLMNVVVLAFLSSRLDREEDSAPFFEQTHQLLRARSAVVGCNDNGTSSTVKADDFQGPTFVEDDPCLSTSSTDCYKTPKNQIAVCLQFKDDNRKLSEWIAYHYYVLPMRHLSIIVDPNSFTSPQPILDQWNGTLGMTIKIWSDEEVFVGPGTQAYIGKLDFETTPVEKLIDIHHARKRHFYGTCMKHYADIGLQWVLLLDVDEYLLYNRIHEDEPYHASTYTYNNATGQYEVQPQILQSLGRDYSSELYDQEASVRSQLLHRTTLPRIDEQKVADYIADHTFEHPWLGRLAPCKMFPRLAFGPVESTATERIQLGNDLDQHFNSTKFDTLRFLHHGQKGNIKHNSYGKALVDVSSSRVRNALEKWQEAYSLRKPMGSLCTEKGTSQNSSLFVVYHYSGSEESFFSIPDKRRTKSQFERRRTQLNVGVNDDIKPWLTGFVKEVGLEKAKELLAGAGSLGIRSALLTGVRAVSENSTQWEDDELDQRDDDDDSDDGDDDDALSFDEENHSFDSIPLNNETGSLLGYKDTNHSVAVCMIHRDGDDHRLSEWLAFHYYTLPLRNVTILMHKNSTAVKSTASILNQWNGTKQMGVDIHVIWTDDDALHSKATPPIGAQLPVRVFYRICMERYRSIGQKWLLILDANEYIMYNHIHPDEKGYDFSYDFVDGENEQSKALRLTNRITMMDSVVDHDKGLILAQTQARLLLPPAGLRKGQTIGTYLWRERNMIHWKELWSPCSVIPRLAYSKAVEPTEEEQRFKDEELGKHFKAGDFDTLRFFHHAEKGSRTQNQSGKPLVNLRHSAVRRFLSQETNNIRRNESGIDGFPFMDLCGHNTDMFGDQNYSTFVINTYVEADDERLSTTAGTNFDVKPWLSGFARQVGLDKAKELLLRRTR